MRASALTIFARCRGARPGPQCRQRSWRLRLIQPQHSGSQKDLAVFAPNVWLRAEVVPEPAPGAAGLPGRWRPAARRPDPAGRRPRAESRRASPGMVLEPGRYIAGASVHAVPSRQESWSQSAVLALGLGVPVVGTAVDGLATTRRLPPAAHRPRQIREARPGTAL